MKIPLLLFSKLILDCTFSNISIFSGSACYYGKLLYKHNKKRAARPNCVFRKMNALPRRCAFLNIVPQIGLILTLSLYADSFSMSRKRNLFFERDFYTIFIEMRINPCSALQRG